jgi:hypothetical protein
MKIASPVQFHPKLLASRLQSLVGPWKAAHSLESRVTQGDAVKLLFGFSTVLPVVFVVLVNVDLVLTAAIAGCEGGE